MADERRENMLPAGSTNRHYSSNYAPPATEPNMPPPPSYDMSASYNTHPLPPQAGNTGLEPSVNNDSTNAPKQSTQHTTLLQTTTKPSDAATESLGNRCRRENWTRKKGFGFGTFLVLVGTLVFFKHGSRSRSKYERTRDFKQGVCKTVDRFFYRPEGKDPFVCDRKSFICEQVVGYIQGHQDTYNHSGLLQIYARTDDINRYGAQCSYTPNFPCASSTQEYFQSSGAFKKGEYTCYFSDTHPIQVILKKNNWYEDLFFPVLAICVGITLLLAVKFFGHRFGCPSDSQMQQQQQQQQEQEIQPTPV